jgi:hypothetical protein
MSRTTSPSNGRPYGVAAVCRFWRVARATVYRHRAPARQAPPRRPGPAGPIPDAALIEAIRGGTAHGLKLRYDHGSQYMADDFQKELPFLGIESSPAFVRAPEGNGCAERFIHTLKGNLLWLRTFDTVEELRVALLEFREINNSIWLIERHVFKPANAVRQDQLSSPALAA